MFANQHQTDDVCGGEMSGGRCVAVGEKPVLRGELYIQIGAVQFFGYRLRHGKAKTIRKPPGGGTKRDADQFSQIIAPLAGTVRRDENASGRFSFHPIVRIQIRQCGANGAPADRVALGQFPL
jgi:hypothetical protein